MPDLTEELRTLGREVRVDADAERFATQVVSALPVSSGAPRSRIRTRVGLAGAAILLALVATPPVRATLGEWFGFGAARVEPGGVTPSGRPSVPALRGGPSPAEAARLVDFALFVPAALAHPDGVEVATDGRRVSMSWGRGGNTVRIDHFAGLPDYALVKQAARMRFVTIEGRDALWFPSAHRIAMLDADGRPAGGFRVADHTMLVPMDDSTVRLEGPMTLDEAVALAASLRRVR